MTHYAICPDCKSDIVEKLNKTENKLSLFRYECKNCGQIFFSRLGKNPDVKLPEKPKTLRKHLEEGLPIGSKVLLSCMPGNYYGDVIECNEIDAPYHVNGGAVFFKELNVFAMGYLDNAVLEIIRPKIV